MKLFKRRPIKSKVSPRKASKTSVSSNTNLAELFRDTVEPAQLDLLKDLDEEFFQNSYLLVQKLSRRDSFVAGKIKRYVDILVRLHARYETEVDEVNTLRLKARSADEKLELALRTTSISEAMMNKMRESLEEAWRNEDAIKSREENIQIQLQNLVRADQSESPKIAREPGQGQEGGIRGMVFRERDRLAGELKDYQKRLATHRIYSEHLEDMLLMAQENISKLSDRLKKSETVNFKLERQNYLAQERTQEREHQLGTEISALQQQNLALQHVQKDLAAMTAAHEALKQSYERLTQNNHNLSNIRRKQEEKKNQLQASLRMAEEKINVHRRNNGELEMARSAAEQNAKRKADESMILERRFRQLAKRNVDLNDQELTNHNEIKLLEKKISVLCASLEEVTSQKDDMTRTRDKLRLEITRLNDTLALARHEIHVVRNQKESLQMELAQVRKLMDAKNQQVQKIAHEKQDLFVELNDAEKKIGGLEEGLANKAERLEVTQLKLQQKQQDFFNTKKQLEILHSDKVMLIKSLDMCSRDRTTMQSTMAKLTHQINQQITALAANEKEINSLKNQNEQLGRAVRQKQNEIHATQLQLSSTRGDLREMKIRVEQTQHTIDNDEKRFKGLSCALDEVTKEKSLVGFQMVRRNDKLRLLQDKLNIMQNAIDRGTTQYNQRLEDIRLLKLEVTNLRMSHECMQKEVGHRSELRQEVIRLERQLNQERLRVSAFSEELSRPCRIHRWRVLMGKDPHRFELIRKVQSLLKLNLRLSVQRENLAKELAEAQSLHEDYKRHMDRRDFPQIHDKLFLQETINRRQKRRLKALTAELRINEIDLKTRDHLIVGFQEQLRQQH
ncbi:hypothetical protein KR059_006394, partial [Drosophila kikkawai]